MEMVKSKMSVNCINGYETNRRVEYLINPQKGRTIVVASDLCAPGHWNDPEYDSHIQYCVERFIDSVKHQPALLQTLKNNPLQYATGQAGASIHPLLSAWCKQNRISVTNASDNYGFKSYLPIRHAFVFGIHRELCVTAHLHALANISPMIKSVCLLDCTVPLLPGEANVPLHIARHHAQVDVVHTQNTSFVD